MLLVQTQNNISRCKQAYPSKMWVVEFAHKIHRGNREVAQADLSVYGDVCGTPLHNLPFL